MQSFREALEERVLICDGAMGTELYARGVFLNRCFDELNLTRPDLVADVHKEYVRAGVDLIETNTFGANRVKLASFGLVERLREINVAASQLARHAAHGTTFVAGSVGPLGIRVEPWGKTGLDEAEEYFREQAEALAEGGVDLFILETFRDVNELGAAVRAVGRVSQAPVVALLTTGEDGSTHDGVPPEEFTPQLEAFGADVIGVNCGVGPAAMLDTIERMAALTGRRLAAQPNAGRPRDIEGRNIYLCSPEYMASYASRFVQGGVRLVGGCCGTTPEHVRQIRAAVHHASVARAVRPADLSAEARSAKAEARHAKAGGAPSGRAARPSVTPVPRAEKSRVASAFARGDFVVGVQLVPPRGHACTALLDAARTAKARGADFVYVPEHGNGVARMSAIAAALLVEQQAGIETLLQYACRDHSLPAIQADLLGAHAMGLRNVLLVTGEPIRHHDYPDATLVFDVDSIGLTNAVARLNQGEDVGGQPIGPPTGFHIGVTANPTAVVLEQEVRRYRYKVEAGAEFLVLQPIFDVENLTAFMERLGRPRLPAVATVQLLGSVRDAEELAHEVPGVHVPARVLERMTAAEAAGSEVETGLEIARELVDALRPLTQGVLIAPARDQVEHALGLLVEGRSHRGAAGCSQVRSTV
ncbi:MAG: bifunctional homocysteine S-methyltransferase/methylenetetrahydrofolate reductase [Luteitalea sp.]|nr:bifunctional homocysteine S-methyltransferase/methylenetetrahydrofolate reductase [Luteitalea sp.]